MEEFMSILSSKNASLFRSKSASQEFQHSSTITGSTSSPGRQAGWRHCWVGKNHWNQISNVFTLHSAISLWSNQVFGLSEAETLFTGAMAAGGNLRIAFSLHPSCFGRHEWVPQHNWQLFWHLLLLGYSNREQWSLTPPGRDNKKTARRKSALTASWPHHPTCFSASMTLGTFVTAGPNRNSSKVTSWSGDSTSQCGELNHTVWSQLSHFLNPE